MEGTITKIQGKKVRIDTALGWFNGTWCSTVQPLLKRYVVELDSDDIINADIIKISKISVANIEYIDDVIYITGLVEYIQNNIMFLRLKESVIMLELEHDISFDKYLGRYVVVSLKNLNIYDACIC